MRDFNEYAIKERFVKWQKKSLFSSISGKRNPEFLFRNDYFKVKLVIFLM